MTEQDALDLTAIIASRNRMRRRACPDCGEPAYSDFMVHNELWVAHTTDADRKEIIHWSCFERRMGREITRDDLTDAPINHVARAILSR